MNKKTIFLVALLCTVLLAVPIFADPVVIRSFTQEGNPALLWYVRDVEGTVDMENSTVRIGDSEGSLESCGKLQDLGGVIYKTVILIDNSLSISEENRQKAKDLACAFLDQAVTNEEFIIYTFDTALHSIGEGADYARLKERVNEIVHNDQDEYIVECLAQVLEENSKDGVGYYDRIVLITDGVDDNPEGRTYGDLRTDLTMDSYRCPIYTAACIWERDQRSLKELSALSAASDGQYFVLDDYEDPAQIAEEINLHDHNADYFTINVPAKEKDGTEKEAVLSLVTSEGSQTLTRSVEGLTRTQEEEQELFPPEPKMTEELDEAEEEAVTEGVTEPETERAEDTVVIVPEPETEKDDKGDSFMKRYWYLIPVLILLAVLIAVIVWLLVRRRKAKGFDDQAFYDMYYQDHPDQGERRTQSDQRPGSSGRSGAGTSGRGAQPIPADSTVAMWGLEQENGAQVRVSLEDLNNPNEQYTFSLKGETLIGRGSDCAVVIATDKSISKHHLRLMPWQGEVVVEDLNSTNGTSINGRKIKTMEQLRSNDILGIGNKRMRVYIL